MLYQLPQTPGEIEGVAVQLVVHRLPAGLADGGCFDCLYGGRRGVQPKGVAAGGPQHKLMKGAEAAGCAGFYFYRDWGFGAGEYKINLGIAGFPFP